MAIGSSYNHPANRAAELLAAGVTAPPQGWYGRFPNPPDLDFNYRKLIESPGGIARAANPDRRIAIVGAGITGLTAARELFRCGYRNISLFEANNRIAGRHYTITDVAGQGTERKFSPFEMAAMRMPFFNVTSEDPLDGISILAYYTGQFGLTFENFPNPGTPFVNGTGIYLYEGLLNGGSDPQLFVWRNPDGETPPPDPKLAQVRQIWQTFEQMMVDVVAPLYGSGFWPGMWSLIVKNYSDMSFRQFVKLEAIPQYDRSNPGYFGGLGMTDEQSDIFYSIGFGDGSWGAFYDVCCLYPLRTAIFGFSSHLQLIHGRFTPDGNYNPGPYGNQTLVPDRNGTMFEAPRYLGVRSYDDCMLFLPIPETGFSPYDALTDSSFEGGLFTSMKVTRLAKQFDGRISITCQRRESAQEVPYGEFDSVIMTIPSWLMEVGMQIEGFTEEVLPRNTVRAWKTAHWETSCKIYAPLFPEFFTDAGNRIPQILVTDSFVHDVYAYKYGVGNYGYPAILISYTWEDDATKLASFSDDELIRKCVVELDRILERCENIEQTISQYIDVDNGKVVRWITEPYALGCAKLYRAGAYGDAVSLLAYNRDYSYRSNFYLAGESFSLDAGWTEPSMRGAIDAVINLCANEGASFNSGFTMNDYPKYIV